MKTFKIALILFAIIFCAATTGQGQSWSLTGNGGTNPPTNFIGTTDAHALVFKANNSNSGYLDYDPAKANSSFGYKSLNVSTGNANTANGYTAMFSNTNGYSNVAVGTATVGFGSPNEVPQ